MEIKALEQKEFNGVITSLHLNFDLDSDFLYDLYKQIIEGISSLGDTPIKVDKNNINHIEIIFYLIGEYIYTLAGLPKSKKIEFLKNEEQIDLLISTVVDKYLSLSLFNHREAKVTNAYFPPISTINTYINFMLNILNTYNKNDPQSTLINDLLTKSLSIARCILTLLVEGYETEAFASWRTLHECECTLILLDRYGEKLIDSYLKHMQYGIAFKDGIKDKAKQDLIFVEIKENMKKLNLKSKDMKKYIEYGWLIDIPEVDTNNFKYNFRDGLETLAGLHMYSDRYMMSSEILHSTPLLIYSNKQYFYYVTLLSLYESIFRLEKVFVTLFIQKFNKDAIEHYQRLRDVYYNQLLNIHRIEMNSFLLFKENEAK